MRWFPHISFSQRFLLLSCNTAWQQARGENGVSSHGIARYFSKDGSVLRRLHCRQKERFAPAWTNCVSLEQFQCLFDPAFVPGCMTMTFIIYWIWRESSYRTKRNTAKIKFVWNKINPFSCYARAFLFLLSYLYVW